MPEKYLKERGLFSNLISLSNLLESEIRKLAKELVVSHFELSILIYISQQETTQYKISKKYNTSTQRSHQIIKKFLEIGYITALDELENGRFLKKLYISPKIEQQLSDVSLKIIKILKEKNITYENLNRIDEEIGIVLEKLNGKI